MIVLILAAGDQSRWGDFYNPKQLVSVNGEPLLGRIIRQCREYDYEPIIVTHDERLCLSNCYHKPLGRRWTVETLICTESLWDDRTVVLLGDVIYSPEAFEKIMVNRASLQVFGRKELRYRLVGRHYEIFALSFDKLVRWDMRRFLREAIYASEAGQPGTLRLFYELYCGLPLGKFQHEDEIFYPVEDWTEDIDTPEDYEQFKLMVEERGWLK